MLFKVALRGEALLHSPRWNKGSAFTQKERKDFGLVGRLPQDVNSLEEQCTRAYAQLENHSTSIGKNSFLQSIRDQVRVLFTSWVDL
jgi:malate dehydrogenase (oxaloacetate-decarboxylating)